MEFLKIKLILQGMHKTKIDKLRLQICIKAKTRTSVYSKIIHSTIAFSIFQRNVADDISLSKTLCSGLSDLTTAGTPTRREIQTATTALRDSRVDSGSVDLETPPDASPMVDETKPGNFSLTFNKL